MLSDLIAQYGWVGVLTVTNFNVFWLIFYGLCIRRGHLDKSYSVPMLAIFANFAWDITASSIAPVPFPQSILTTIFSAIGVVLFWQAIHHWKSDFPNIPTIQFYIWMLVSFVFSMLLTITYVLDNRDYPPYQIAFIDTFINSALFIVMFYHRQDTLRGQSIYIGLSKLIGTTPFLLWNYLQPAPHIQGLLLLPVLYMGIFLLDLAYVILYYIRAKQLNQPIWGRF
ncbi:MAG: hypothetical protein ACOYLB_01020 [Phototrophicaceae bacterium]